MSFVLTEKLIVAVKKMREKQRLYFKTRDRMVMLECKRLENEVDLILEDIERESKNVS